MSKLTGIFSKNRSEINKFVNNDIKKDTTVSNKNLVIKIKGLKNETYFYKTYKDKGWISLGVGLIKKGGKFKIMDNDLWESAYLSGDLPVNGHFLFVKWNINSIEICTDPLGIRDMYYYKDNEKILFSTKMDYLVNLIPNLHIDFKTIGGDYLLGRKLIFKTEIEEIHRIGPDTSALFSLNKIKLNRRNTFLNNNVPNNNISKYFKSILSITEDYNISLGLSGGVDSRILLSYLLRYYTNFTTHSFGSMQDKDNILANTMSNNIGFRNTLYSEYDKKNIINNIRDFLSFNPFNLGIDRIPFCYYFSELRKNNHILADGQFGEFMRKDPYRILKPLNILFHINRSIVFKLLRRDIPPIFTPFIFDEMEKGALEQVEIAISHYIDSYKRAIHFKDYIALLYNFPNLTGRDQSRIDEYCISTMPFAQTDLIKDLIYPHRRIINENLIKTVYPQLSHYPFVKNNKYYPFNHYKNRFAKVREKLCNEKNENSIYKFIYFIDNFKEYIFDELNSHKFKNNSILNKDFITNSIVDFYKSGGKRNINVLRYFLSFYMVPQINKLI